jgi:uncharacterized protein YpmB
MKKRFLSVAILLSAFVASAEDVKIEEVPEAVRATIQKRIGLKNVEEVDRDDRHGKIVFEVLYEDERQNSQALLIDEDGKLLEEWQKSTP